MPILNIESLDDPLAFEGTNDFSGGQASNARSTAIATNQASLLDNWQLSVSGELRKRKGTANVSIAPTTTVTGSASPVQCLFWYDTTTERILMAASGGDIYYLDADNEWTLYCDANITDTAEFVNMAQLSDWLYWTDSSKTGIRTFDGDTVSTVADSPIATILLSFTNRLIASGVATVPDAIYFSSFLDGDAWAITTDAIRIGGGDGDRIVSLMGWQDSLLIVLKQRSSWVVDINPLLAIGEFVVKQIHRTIGCAAARSVAQVGQDVFFLSRSGVMSIQKQLATSNNEIAIPISYPIQDVIDDINWGYADRSVGIFYNNHYILAVPVDANWPDTLIAFNTITKGWTIASNCPAIVLCEQPFEARTRLVGGLTDGRVFEWLDYQDESDEDADTFTNGGTPVVSIARTRAYTFGEPINNKNGWYLECEFRERDGEADIYAVFDGKDTRKALLGHVEFAVQQAILPAVLPVQFPITGWQRVVFPLHGPEIPPFRDIQIEIRSESGNCVVRNVVISAFIDTMEFR